MSSLFYIKPHMSLYPDSSLPEGSKIFICRCIPGSRGLKMLANVQQLFEPAAYTELHSLAETNVVLLSDSIPLFNALAAEFPNITLSMKGADELIWACVGPLVPVTPGEPRYEPQMPSLIEEGLYLGDTTDATSERVIKELGIGAVINCTTKEPFGTFKDVPRIVEQIRIPVIDRPGEDVAVYFAEVAATIARLLGEGKKVLVHCAAGISRSPTFVAAYLMKSRSIGMMDALSIIATARSKIEPNIGFIGQLHAFELSLSAKRILQQL